MSTRKVTVRAEFVRGKRKWRVRRWENGKPKRTYFSSKSEADAEAADLKAQADRTGTAWLSLASSDRERLISAYTAAKKNGHDINELVANAGASRVINSPPLNTVIDELVSAKESAGRSSRYTDNLKIILGQFSAGRESMTIDTIGILDVESFLNSKTLASRSTLRARLSTLFKFSIRRGYRLDNPCSRLEPIKVPKATPAVFTVEQFEAAFDALYKTVKPSKHSPRVNYRHGLPWFVLTTLCGLRPEEAEKTTAADIHFKEGWIKVEAQTTKVRQRRIVYPRKEALALLKSVMKEGRLPLNREAKRRVIWRLRDGLGFAKWPKDITRHTAASYWLAVEPSAAKIAEMLGNSEKVLKRDYKALVTKSQGRKFWSAVKKISAP